MKRDSPAETVRKEEARAKKEALERAFALLCRQHELKPEAQFRLPDCDYVWDYAFRAFRLLIEIQGGIYQKTSGHKTPGGLKRDYRKNNVATIRGWDTLYFTGDDIADASCMHVLNQYFDTHYPF